MNKCEQAGKRGLTRAALPARLYRLEHSPNAPGACQPPGHLADVYIGYDPNVRRVPGDCHSGVRLESGFRRILPNIVSAHSRTTLPDSRRAAGRRRLSAGSLHFCFPCLGRRLYVRQPRSLGSQSRPQSGQKCSPSSSTKKPRDHSNGGWTATRVGNRLGTSGSHQCPTGHCHEISNYFNHALSYGSSDIRYSDRAEISRINSKNTFSPRASAIKREISRTGTWQS